MALGKGLEALIPEKLSKEESKEFLVSLDRIYPNPHQPRKDFDKEKLDELVNSIKEHGIIQPIIVSAKDGGFQLVAGERRLRAAKLAGLKEVPVILKDYKNSQLLEIALIENLQREDLNSLEEAQAYQFLIKEYGFNQEILAQKVGKSRSAVANSLRLLNLDLEFKEDLLKEVISPGHARAILSLEKVSQKELWRRIKKFNLSVRQTEKLAGSWQNKKNTPKKSKKSADWISSEERLTQFFSTLVKIKAKGGKGKIEISYSSLEELDRIFNLIFPKDAFNICLL